MTNTAIKQFLTTQQLKGISRECREYAEKYNCSLHDAIADWEGDGPSGSWGLTPSEKSEIAHELKSVQGFNLDQSF